MEVLYPRCAGVDVHASSITAWLRIAAGDEVTYQHRTVGTTTAGLLELAEWLHAPGCTHVAMEATGVYWKPVGHVLEGQFTLVLANAMHLRNVPGRKSDVNDATWIADLLAHGLIRSSSVAPEETQELRELTRTRKQMSRTLAKQALRIQKLLEDATVELSSRGQRHPRQGQSSDSRSHHRRRDRSRSSGSAQGPIKSHSRRAGVSVAWTCDRKSPCPADCILIRSTRSSARSSPSIGGVSSGSNPFESESTD